MSFADTPYAGIQKFLPGQEFVIPLRVRQALRPAGLPRQHDDPPFDPNGGVTYSVVYSQARTPTLVTDYPMIRVAPGLYQATYSSQVGDLPGMYLVEAIATHGSKVQRTYYRGAFVLVQE